MRAPALVALLVLAPLPARAYVRAVTPGGTPWHWDRPVVTLSVHAGAPGPTLTSEELVQAAARAAAPWSQPALACTSVALAVEPLAEGGGSAKRDGVNRVVFRRDRWCPEPQAPDEPCYTSQALALTTDAVELRTGRIVESDVEVNAIDHTWTDRIQHPGADGYDLQNTLTHELGHLLGFAHSCRLKADEPLTVDDRGRPVTDCADASPEALASTMYPTVSETDLDRRSLTEDDQRGVCDVYPKGITSGQTLVEAGGGGGCDVGRGRPAGFVLVLVLVLETRRRLRDARVRVRVRVRARNRADRTRYLLTLP